MKISIYIVLASCLFVCSNAFAEDDFTFSKRDGKVLSGLMKEVFDARLIGDKEKEYESKSELNKLIKSIEEKQKKGDLLKHTDAWHLIRAGTKDDKGPIPKLKGRGFKEEEFVDYAEINECTYKYYVSVPRKYKMDSEEKLPVIIFLHPEVEGRKIEREVQVILKNVYSDKYFLDNFVIIAPIGPMEGSGRRQKLVDAAIDWDELKNGRKTAFVAVRLLLEQVVFDRSKVFLDGIGKAGLSAIRYATWYPGCFSGVINRDGPIETVAMENIKDIPCLYISSSNNKNEKDAAKWAEEHSDGEVPQVTFVKDSGKSLEPGPEATEAAKTWLEKVGKDTVPKNVYIKAANLDVAGKSWLRINSLNAGLNMDINDPDCPWIEGEIDRESNSIILKSNRVLALTVFLNDKMLDLDKSITIILNDKNRFEGKVERNFDKMLDLIYYNSAADYEVYCNYKQLSEEE